MGSFDVEVRCSGARGAACSLRRRGADSEEQLRLRLATARREMDAACHFDHVVVNAEGKLEEAVVEVERIIAAEKERPERGPVEIP